MIIGLGNDIVDIRRVEKVLARFGARFEQRCFTQVELAKAESRAGGGQKVSTLAKRYAAKEAGAKALGTGLAQGVSWKEIGVENLEGGQPCLILKGRAKQRLEDLTPSGYLAHIHLSLTDEPPYAQAQVIIEARPKI